MSVINLASLEDNKVSIDLSGYPVVFLGKTGDGKTYSLNKYLRAVAPGDKVPLFIMLEDRHKAIPNIRAQRAFSIPDILQIVGQLKNPKVRELFSSIVIDTMDKFEEMADRYVASTKSVEITEDIGYGKGSKYLKSKLGILTEIRNLGLPVHFTAQLYENKDFNSGNITYKTKLNGNTTAQMFHDAFLVGVVKLDSKSKDPINSDRLVSFRKTSEYIDLKDTFGLPSEMYIADIKQNLENYLNNQYEPSQLSDGIIIEEVVEQESFETLQARGKELGSLLFEKGYVDEAINILTVNIGKNEDGSPMLLESLIPAQIDVVKIVVMKLEEVAIRHGLV